MISAKLRCRLGIDAFPAPFLSERVRREGRHIEREGLAKILPVKVPIELPPVGIISLRGRTQTPACEQFLSCLRRVARSATGAKRLS
jgi:hypothetical protein